MLSPYTDIFAHAAVAQQALFVGLSCTAIVSAVTAIRPIEAFAGFARSASALRLACPMLGILCAALNGLHMTQTIVRLPFPVTAGMLAPGVMEMAALVAAGALAGLVAALSYWRLQTCARNLSSMA